MKITFVKADFVFEVGGEAYMLRWEPISFSNGDHFTVDLLQKSKETHLFEHVTYIAPGSQLPSRTNSTRLLNDYLKRKMHYDEKYNIHTAAGTRQL